MPDAQLSKNSFLSGIKASFLILQNTTTKNNQVEKNPVNEKEKKISKRKSPTKTKLSKIKTNIKGKS